MFSVDPVTISGLRDTLKRPDVHFHCDILFDPFRYMEENNKVYGSLPSPWFLVGI